MYTFRQAVEEDFSAIASLPQNAQEAYYMFPRGTWPLQAEELYRASLERELAIVMERNGELMGYCSLYHVAEGDAAWLGNVIVSPAARASGASAELIGYMTKQGREAYRLKELHLVCHSSNVRAMLFYRRLGFLPYDVAKTDDWQGNRIARILMKRTLSEAAQERLRLLESDDRRKQLPPEQLLRALPLEAVDAVLDLGAGGGYLTLPASARAKGMIYAVDADPLMRDVLESRVQRRGIANIRVLEGRAEQLPLSDASVGVVLASLILHILDDPGEGVRELLRVLKPGGVGLIVEWAEPRPDGKQGHRVFQPDMVRLLEAAGAAVIGGRAWGECYYSLLFRKA
jgi:ubiquinone/menaquinone biosynthesis C-methylase UbiE/N-acetylglutamate synthase-like GNAT family acetyltransferase